MIEPIDNNKKKTLIITTYVLTVVSVILTIILIVLLFVASPLTVSGPSMQPTLEDKEHIFIQKIGFNIERDDIVVFEKDGSKKIIKRVIGVEGDVIRYDIYSKKYIRNGERLEETYIFEPMNDSYITNPNTEAQRQLLSSNGLKVKSGEIFVLGDNRNVSNDSHIYGAISIDLVIGKYLFKY